MAELTIKARINNLDAVLAFVDAELEKLDCPLRKQLQIDVAVEEVFVNIARYAYVPGEGDAVIRVETVPEPRSVNITFRDRGVPYNPLAKPDPDVTLPAAQRQIGGLGIFMVKKNMDAMHYAYQDGQNVLTLTKMLE